MHHYEESVDPLHVVYKDALEDIGQIPLQGSCPPIDLHSVHGHARFYYPSADKEPLGAWQSLMDYWQSAMPEIICHALEGQWQEVAEVLKGMALSNYRTINVRYPRT